MAFSKGYLADNLIPGSADNKKPLSGHIYDRKLSSSSGINISHLPGASSPHANHPG